MAMTEIVVTLVSGNASWWKQRKYRRETAHRLRRLRAEGWRLAGFERLPQAGVDTRSRTAYRLVRNHLGGNGAPGSGGWAGRRAIEGGERGKSRALP